MFQQKINRSYTSGFAGEVSRDGPLRAKPARIVSETIGTDPAKSTNRISRVFGWFGEQGIQGKTLSANCPEVIVGGAKFYGVLFHPKHYVLNGTVAGGSLAASYDLPKGYEGEFADMAIMHAELFNETTAAKDIGYGDALAYVSDATTAAQNPNALPLGAIVSYPAGGAVPDGLTPIPNARVINPIAAVAASAPGAVVSVVTQIQLTQ
ncbi:hypothetical protein BcepF1.118 [Burkholderia phage BcepF1]|uniref:Uncharacterized protein n=1 Tax=Burkholderia phage BcepF1 TaxID=2886897 RepID=A1Z022_9CAUD|nr:virion structural protein [Burkholderia phage BcepF1]ABL96849.1 hypothetical protein BcepF1.118 [Burkholderia phage BcepF1]